MKTFEQLAQQMIETFNPHPNATSLVHKHKTHRNARKHLKKLGATKSEQSKLIRAVKDKDPAWPKYK